MIGHFLNIYSSTLVSMLTGWKGTTGSRKTSLPDVDLVLFDREGCSDCRAVREAITELNLDVDIYPCPEEGRRFKDELGRISGSDQIPFLYDKNNDKKIISKDLILAYLFKSYGNKEIPKKFETGRVDGLFDSAIKLLRRGGGVHARSSLSVEKPLTLYSFESSPFSRPVRELLCELELPYKLVNLGKQQKADMGPAAFRFHTGPYKPVKGSKREQFLADHGDVMVPYLEDPNTNAHLFQSRDILKYLNKTYAKS